MPSCLAPATDSRPRPLVGHAKATTAIAPTGSVAPTGTAVPAAHARTATAARIATAAGNGGGAGSTGSSIWSWVWWLGSPQGPGPYTGRAAGGLGLCAWHDVGSSMSNLNSALANAGLPAIFWTAPRGGGYPGIWTIDLWGAALTETGRVLDHFDVVACPTPGQVPTGGGAVESDLPSARTPTGKVMYLWIFWDTVPDPSSSNLPPLINAALARAKLPSPIISTSPSSIDQFKDTTIVNFPTWLWIPRDWTMVKATAAGGGLVATAWATPMNVTWRAEWSFPDPRDDPEGGVTFEPESLDLVCPGPGSSYEGSLSPAAQATACESIFSQSTFGTYQGLEASISWQVNWALSDDAGVVGGEGLLANSVTSATRPASGASGRVGHHAGLSQVPWSYGAATTRTASAANRQVRGEERWAGRLTPYIDRAELAPCCHALRGVDYSCSSQQGRSVRLGRPLRSLPGCRLDASSDHAEKEGIVPR